MQHHIIGHLVYTAKKAIMSEGELTVNIAVVKVMKTRLFLLQQKHT